MKKISAKTVWLALIFCLSIPSASAQTNLPGVTVTSIDSRVDGRTRMNTYAEAGCCSATLPTMQGSRRHQLVVDIACATGGAQCAVASLLQEESCP